MFKGGPFRVSATAPSGREFCVGQKVALGFFFFHFLAFLKVLRFKLNAT